MKAVQKDLRARGRRRCGISKREKVPATFKHPQKKTFLIFLENCEFYLQYFKRQKNYICMQNAEGGDGDEDRKSPNKRWNDDIERGKREEKKHTQKLFKYDRRK